MVREELSVYLWRHSLGLCHCVLLYFLLSSKLGESWSFKRSIADPDHPSFLHLLFCLTISIYLPARDYSKNKNSNLQSLANDSGCRRFPLSSPELQKAARSGNGNEKQNRWNANVGSDCHVPNSLLFAYNDKNICAFSFV